MGAVKLFLRNKLVAFLTVLLIIGNLFSYNLVLAESDSEKELEEVRQQMDVKEEEVTEKRQKVISISEQLKTVQLELEKINTEYEDILIKLDVVQQRIDRNESELKGIEDDLASKTILLNKRMRDIYKNGQVSYIEVLFGAQNFGDFVSRLELLKTVIRRDITLITEVKLKRNTVLLKKEELQKSRVSLEELRKEAEAKKDIIEERKQEHEEILHNAIYERDTAERAYRELQETSRRIENMIRGGNYGSGQGTGVFVWPISGSITSDYGWRTHPIFGTSRFHSGLDIGADYGDSVVAADSGTVIYSDWQGGYGKTVMIDHGGGLVTLYAHNSELAVYVGQNVSKGQLIAYAGSTGYSTGPHVHFEVRVNGSTTNPLDYLN